MGLNGGGYTFINSVDVADMTSTELNALFTDKTSFLLRLRKCDGTQPYVVLQQLSQYENVPLSIQLNSNTDYTTPVNFNILGSPYLYFGFLPKQNVTSGTTQGMTANGVEHTFINCDSNQNNYFALFANYQENQPSDYSVPLTFISQVLSESKANPSTRVMPVKYFYFMEGHFGGCGDYTQTDSRLDCILSAAIGFR